MKMNQKKSLGIVFGAVLALVSVQSFGAVLVDGTFSKNFTDLDVSGDATTMAVTVNGANSNRMLVVAIGFEAGTGGGTIQDVKWNGVSLTLATPVGLQNGSRAQIWYLADPDGGNNALKIYTDNNNQIADSDLAVGIFSLYNVAGSAPAGIRAYNKGTDDATNTISGSVTFTGISSGAYAIDAGTVNGNGGSESVVYGSGQTQVDFYQNGGTGFRTGISGYLNFGPSDPNVSQKWGPQGTQDPNRIAYTAVYFNAVPEPATLALLGLGALCIAGRRRAS